MSRSGRWRGRVVYGWWEHGLPLLLFTLLSIAASWPVVAHFNEALASGGGDARHNLWVLWHTREFFAGRQPLFSTELLYYPAGISLLTHGLGPVTGVLALPFWPWGPEAAHNGAVLVSLALTGYFMYLLARGLGLNRPVAFFAGLVLLTAPMHLAGIYGHMTKVFLGLIPLALLAGHHALDERRSPWWVVGTALVLLATLLHNGYQFVYTVLALGFFTVWILAGRARDAWRPLLVRLVWLGLSVLVIVGPLFLATLRASSSDVVSTDLSTEAINNQPDVVELFVPPVHSRLLGPAATRFLVEHNVRPTIETAISLSVMGMVLCAVALFADRQRALPWLVFLGICVVFALGPTLKILGDRYFTDYSLPVIMPFAFLIEVPGLSFMRASGRFMMVGYVALSMAAAYGLNALCARWPRLAWPLVLAAGVVLLLETWPGDWPLEELRPTPAFYEELAADSDLFGVLDLPIMPTESGWYPGYYAYYQMDQMTHRKGIAAGYLSRVYDAHPQFPCLYPALRPAEADVLTNGAALPCYQNLLYDLALSDYRYVVRHKPQPGDTDFTPDSWGEAETQRFVDLFLADQEPLVDDDLVTVYAVPLVDPAELSPVFGLWDNWYRPEPEWRWARSPAGLFLSLPRPVQATLEFEPYAFHEPAGRQVVGDEGVLTVALNGEPLAEITVTAGEVVRLPLDLPAGVHRLTLTLAAGNFRPVDHGGSDQRELGFAVRYLNLMTE